jgi:hypothetical protein
MWRGILQFSRVKEIVYFVINYKFIFMIFISPIYVLMLRKFRLREMQLEHFHNGDYFICTFALRTYRLSDTTLGTFYSGKYFHLYFYCDALQRAHPPSEVLKLRTVFKENESTNKEIKLGNLV